MRNVNIDEPQEVVNVCKTKPAFYLHYTCYLVNGCADAFVFTDSYTTDEILQRIIK